jgi:THO complex subunit 1
MCGCCVWSSEAERKTILDQTFRDALKEKLLANDHRLTDLVTLATDCVKEGMCSAALPFILLGDAFDCVTLDVCEKAFSYVENNVALWTSVFNVWYLLCCACINRLC